MIDITNKQLLLSLFFGVDGKAMEMKLKEGILMALFPTLCKTRHRLRLTYSNAVSVGETKHN